MEGSSALPFVRAAYRAGIIKRRQLLGSAWANVQFRLQGASDQGTEELIGRIREALAGLPVLDLSRLRPDVIAGILPRVYPEMLKTAYAHQDAGRRAYIVTAASHNVAELVAHVLVLDGGIGTHYEVEDGVYTGRLIGPINYGEGKAEAMRRMAEEEGIDLAESYAYSDAASDLPMLRVVGHPVVVNPDRELERIAREEGWEIMRFDKLARRLRIASLVGAGAVAVGLAGWGGGYLAGRFRPGERVRARPLLARLR